MMRIFTTRWVMKIQERGTNLAEGILQALPVSTAARFVASEMGKGFLMDGHGCHFSKQIGVNWSRNCYRASTRFRRK